MRTLLWRCLAVAGCALLAACDPVPQGLHQGNHAANEPDKFAWELLGEIGRPAGNGTPDADFETWATADDIYNSKWPSFPGRRHRALQLRIPAYQRLGVRDVLIPPDPLEEEIRINRADFDYILSNRLWSKDGQKAAFRNRLTIRFPKDAVEIKAQWGPIHETDKSNFHWNVGSDGKLYGLRALHISSKDLPNWFWATFEYFDNQNRCKVNGCSDTFGFDSATNKPSLRLKELLKRSGLGGEWLNYRLTGSQTSFADSTGRTLYLGNSIIEMGIMNHSSCISCHAEPRLGPDGFMPQVPVARVGIPNPCIYFGDGEGPDGPICGGAGAPALAIQADFVWSLSEAR